MQIPIDKQISFLTWQIKEHELAFLSYLKKPMNQHFREKSAFCGKIWGVDEKRGTLIIRFHKGLAPRLKSALAAFVFSGVPNVDDLAKWTFNYQYFRENYIKAGTDISPIFYLSSEEKNYSYIGCRDIEAGFFNSILKALNEGKKPSIILAEKDPPIQYLLNLRDFISDYPKDETLNIQIEKSLDEWQPNNLDTEDNKSTVINSLENVEEVIIQGPPGTGKSHLIAAITEKFLSKGNTVCITALTNKALMEVAEKPGIKHWIESESVFKTNLTFDEKSKLRKLQRAENLSIGKGELLLSTYYKLSDWYKKDNSEAQRRIKPIYDLVIIEEASQSFLATIAAFKLLARKVLIVGDPLQLPPIVINESSALTIHPRIMDFAKGLETYVANANKTSFILTKSYRLSSMASKQTGIFYKNKLTSVQKDKKTIISVDEFKKFISSDGSAKLAYLPLISGGDRPANAIDFVVKLASDLVSRNPGFELAILSPFKATVLALQEKISEVVDDFSNLTIETIDRIQGLTADFTIFVLVLSNPSFAMNLNRFNVATSRAKSGTLIITDRDYARFMGIDPLVTKYLSSLESTTI